MFTIIASVAAAAFPYEAGPLQPLPMTPNDVAVASGKVVLLTEEHIYTQSPEGWRKTGLEGGRAIATSDDGTEVAVCRASGVTTYTLDATEITALPCVDIAPVPGGYWVLNDDGVFQVPGDVPVAVEAPEVLGGGPELTWISGNRLFMGASQRLVFPGATDVTAVRTETYTEWILVHPERSLLGILGDSGLESAWPQPLAATHVAVGDLGGDGVVDLVLVGDEGWMVLTDTRKPPPPPEPPPPALATAPPPTTLPPPRHRPETMRVLGARFPKFAGLSPDTDYDGLFIGGFGVALGKPLGSNQIAVGFSPSAVGGVEYGRNRLRTYFGADSAPLYSWAGNSVGIHLVMATAGFSVGSDRLRAGPFASIGLLGVGAGVRAVFTPFESRAGKLTGFEGRLTWFYPNAGHAALYYVSAFPMGRRARARTQNDPRRSLCRRFNVGLGASGGFSSTAYAWEFVGRDADYQFSGSPALTLACESGSKSAGWMLGGETAPFFFYRVPVSDQGADRRLSHMGSATIGLFAGGDAARLGPILTAGIWTLGAGMRVVLTPFRTKSGATHGLELRAIALYPSSPAMEGMATYTVAFDPAGKRRRD